MRKSEFFELFANMKKKHFRVETKKREAKDELDTKTLTSSLNYTTESFCRCSLNTLPNSINFLMFMAVKARRALRVKNAYFEKGGKTSTRRRTKASETQNIC